MKGNVKKVRKTSKCKHSTTSDALHARYGWKETRDANICHASVELTFVTDVVFSFQGILAGRKKCGSNSQKLGSCSKIYPISSQLVPWIFFS